MRTLYGIFASSRQEDLDPDLRAAVVAFLRSELPQDARRTYREMIQGKERIGISTALSAAFGTMGGVGPLDQAW